MQDFLLISIILINIQLATIIWFAIDRKVRDELSEQSYINSLPDDTRKPKISVIE